MDDDGYEGFIEDDFFSAIYVALDRLEELDPSSAKEPWFQLIGATVDKILAPHIEKVEPTKH